MLPGGIFVPLELDPQKLQDCFADKVLSALVKGELLTQETVDSMKSWPHSSLRQGYGLASRVQRFPGWAADDDTKQRLFVARYLKKCPISKPSQKWAALMKRVFEIAPLISVSRNIPQTSLLSTSARREPRRVSPLRR
jgi:hypothetical protein